MISRSSNSRSLTLFPPRSFHYPLFVFPVLHLQRPRVHVPAWTRRTILPPNPPTPSSPRGLFGPAPNFSVEPSPCHFRISRSSSLFVTGDYRQALPRYRHAPSQTCSVARGETKPTDEQAAQIWQLHPLQCIYNLLLSVPHCGVRDSFHPLREKEKPPSTKSVRDRRLPTGMA